MTGVQTCALPICGCGVHGVGGGLGAGQWLGFRGGTFQLAVLGSFAYPATALVQLLLRLSLFGAMIEVVQAIPALHRDSDVLDWLADTAAVLVVLLIVRWWRSRG